MKQKETEKRELLEQQQKILEAGAQRADKRTGSFSFLTWPFFIAPLIAGEEFLSATLKAEAGEEEDGKAAQASAALQGIDDDSSARDPAKTAAADELANGPAALSQTNAPPPDPSSVGAQPHEGGPKPSSAHSESVAAAHGGGGDGGGDGDGDDAESRAHDPRGPAHDAHNSTDGSSVNALADSHLGSSQLPGGSTLDFVGSSVLGNSFSPPVDNSGSVLGSFGGHTNDVVGVTALVEATVQSGRETVADSLGTLTDDTNGVIPAPIETTMPPVLVNDSVGTLINDAAGITAPPAPVETAVQPVLETVSDSVGTLTEDVTGVIAPVETAMQPVLETVSDSLGTLTDEPANDVPSAAASAGAAVNGVAVGSVDPVLAPAPGSEADSGNQVATDTNNVIAPHVGSAGLVSGVVAPVLPDLPDLLNGLQAAAPDSTGTSTDHTIATAVPGAVTPDASPPAITDAESQPITLSQTVASDPTGTHTSDSSASALDGLASATSDIAPSDAPTDALANVVSGFDTTEPSLTTTSSALSDLTTTSEISHSADSGNLDSDNHPTVASDTLPSAAPVVDTTEPVQTTTSATLSDASSVVSHLTDSGNLASDTLPDAAPVVDTASPVLTTTSAALSDPISDMSHPTDSATLAGDTLPSAAPGLDTTEPVHTTTSAALSDSASSEVLHPTDSANSASDTLPSAAPGVDTPEPVLATTSTALSDPSGGSHPTESANLVGDAIPDAAPVADTTEPVLTTTPAVLSDSTSEVSPPADSGNLTSGTLATNASAAPGADITSPVLASTGDSLPATDLSPEGSTDQAAGPADTLLALATADAPIEVPQAATAPASDAASAEPIAFEGDVIALDGAEQPPENALFTGTQYTDYGVTLSSNIEIPQQTAAASSADAASTQDTAVPIAGSDVHQPAPAPDVVDTTTPIDHLGLRDAVL